MSALKDGPVSPLFSPVGFDGSHTLPRLAKAGISPQMAEALKHAPTGACVSWGVPFDVRKVVLVREQLVTATFPGMTAPWLLFLHTSDLVEPDLKEEARRGWRGTGRLGEHAANYVIVFADGTEERVEVRRRFQVGGFQRPWGDNCFEARAHVKPRPCHGGQEQTAVNWGSSQTRVDFPDMGSWVNWVWAWENPHPNKRIRAIRFEPVSGNLVVSGITAGRTSSHPLKWDTRQKAVLTLPKGVAFDPTLDATGMLSHLRIDLGQVISAQSRPVYPNAKWAASYNNRLPDISDREVLVEYAAHPQALFHLGRKQTIPVARLRPGKSAGPLQFVAPSDQAVTIRVVEKGSRRPVAVKLHVHGEAGEYLAPVDRHRIPNSAWFEDYSVDFAHCGLHFCAYIDGETRMNLPVGRVYIEIAKGFEIRPVREARRVTRGTRELVIEIEKVLPWRKKGWVSADTHVHFLSPPSARLEGAAEGVNIVNLLASQWGELMTNVGDFDGRTTFGSKEAGGDGEYMVRVGTENRQHVLGHISLLGYGGRINAPMTTGGPHESALGDPVGNLLTQWARQCHSQGGIVVIPHFPNPRAEHAVTIVEGEADAVEMTAWGNLYGGIDPYSLLDWYRYLNCGYKVAAVGGTDKMSSQTAVGTVRTYARIPAGTEFTYNEWMRAVRRGETFVTYGPLLEFAVDGHPSGARIAMSAAGGTVDVLWNASSVTVPMTRVELIVNGEVRESQPVASDSAEGRWSVKLDRSSWLALLVRGHYADKPEIITAHTSPVMVDVAGSPFFSAADAMTILEQIEGSMAYLDTVGTRAETKTYREMRLILTAAHRELHNRLHAKGHFHRHTPKTQRHSGH